MIVDLQPHGDGVKLAVKAQPGAGRNELRAPHGGALRVAVTQAPEKGKANRAIIVLLADALGLRKSQVKLVSGANSTKKTFMVEEMTVAELARRIAAAVP